MRIPSGGVESADKAMELLTLSRYGLATEDGLRLRNMSCKIANIVVFLRILSKTLYQSQSDCTCVDLSFFYNS